MVTRFTTRRALVFLILAGPVLDAAATGLDEYFEQYEAEQAAEREAQDTDEAADSVGQSGTPADAMENETGPAQQPSVFVPTLTRADELLLPIDSRILYDTDLPLFLAAVEADRRLLSELRKPVPENREDAIIYLRRLKRLAELSDPIRLAMVADRVLEQAPIYFDWLETEFESDEDRVYDYYIGGAQGFNRALNEFQNAALMTVVNRLDTASRIIQANQSAQQ